MSGHEEHSRRRLKFAASINDEVLGEDTKHDYQLQYIDIGNVYSSGSVDEPVDYQFKDAPSRARRRVRAGDIIISCVRTYLQAIVPIRNPPANLVVSTGFAVVRPSPDFLDPRFASYAVREPSFLAEIEKRSVGVSYPAINPSDLADIPITLPPLPEQRAIADYLDRETARLDGLVAAKERVLELLAEKRQALIARAVTRGIAPDVSYRDSGVSWLGEIPAHWKLVALRFLVDMIGGATPDTGRTEYWDGDTPWVSPKDMKQDEISDTGDCVSALAVSETALRVVPEKSVLVVVRGMILAHSFPVAMTTGPVTINQDMKALLCRDVLDPLFLRDFLRASKNYLVSMIDSAAHGTKKLEARVLENLQVPLPPLGEQRKISDRIASDIKNLDLIRAATVRAMDLLKERRSVLISAAVTGRVDVERAA